MVLRYIDRGTAMSVYEEMNQQILSEKFEGTFYDLQNETSFVFSSHGLRDHYDKLNPNGRLNISFTRGSSVYTFSGRAREIVYGGPGDLVLIEQTTGIETLNRRAHPRDELHVDVKLYGLPKEQASNTEFASPDGYPELADKTFDISAGGMCILSNTYLNSPYDPYYLVEFSIGGSDEFVIPAEIVRRRDSTQSWLGKYDYGFRFIYDSIPDTQSRLINAIFNTKLSRFG